MAPEAVQRRLAAIWNADAVGYSRLMAADDAGTFDELRTRRELLRARIADHGGRTVDAVGDDFLAEFPSAVAAVECAIAVQAQLAARDAGLPESRRLPFRVGIQLGEVLVDGGVIAGDAVNVAARIRALAGPGQVFVTAAVHDQVRAKLARGFEDRGEHELKNIPGKVRIYRVMSDSPSESPRLPIRAARPAIAVLPLLNLTGDPQQQYLADGIAEDLLTRMARWQIPAIARQSSFAFRDQSRDVREVGRALGARYVVEGSLRKVGSRVRVAMQLIDAETGSHVWAENFDRELGDPLAVQDEIARTAEHSMSTRLGSFEVELALSSPPESLGAWEAFNRAVWHHNRRTADDWREARRLLREAVALEPRFADAHAFLSIVEYIGVMNLWTSDSQLSLANAASAAQTSLTLDPENLIVPQALGLGAFVAGDWTRAQAAFERAIALQRGSAGPLVLLGWFLNTQGRHAEALGPLERAVALVPRAHPGDAYVDLGIAYFGLGRDEDALRVGELALQVSSQAFAHGLVACILGHLGRLDAARHELAQLPPMRLRDVEALLARQMPRRTLDRALAGLRLAGMPE